MNDFSDKPSKSCFVITPLGDIGSRARVRADALCSELLQPAAEKHHLSLIRGDRIPNQGTVVVQVIREIVDSFLDDAPRIRRRSSGGTPVDQEYRAGRGGWMWGLQYFPPLERRMAIGVDPSRHSVQVDDPMPGLVKAEFWKAVVLIRVRRTPQE